MRNPSFYANFFIFHFLSHFWFEIGCGIFNSMGPPDPTQKVGTLGQGGPFRPYIEIIFRHFQGGPSGPRPLMVRGFHAHAKSWPTVWTFWTNLNHYSEIMFPKPTL